VGNKMGYWIDLTTVKFDDSSPASWIQIMPLGTYEHPVYGEINITPERIQRFAANVKAHVRGQDLDIDYDHKAKTGEAAGWLKDAEARADGLWGLVEWTQDAYSKITSKAYRYFSPEFQDEWEHPKTKETHQDVLFGGALTNRPFLKDIMPINMNEVYGDARQLPEEGGAGVATVEIDSATINELAQLVGLPDGSSVDHVVGALRVLRSQADSGSGGETAPPSADGESAPVAHTQPVAASIDEEVIRLAEQSKDPAVQKLGEWAKAQATREAQVQKQLAETTAALRLSETDRRLQKLSEGKKSVLTPAALEVARSLILSAPEKFGQQVEQLLQAVVEGKATVQLGEFGHVGGGQGDKNGADLFLDEVNAVMKADNLAFSEAMSRVASLKPQLYYEYTQNSYAFHDEK
jgi:Mu-like prophage I protein